MVGMYGYAIAFQTVSHHVGADGEAERQEAGQVSSRPSSIWRLRDGWRTLTWWRITNNDIHNWHRSR